MKYNSGINLHLPSPVSISIVSHGQGQDMCPSCELSFADEESLNLHLNLVKHFQAQCGKCLKFFTTEKGMKRHYGRKHVKNRPSRCRVCYKRFRNKYSLRFHIIKVHEKKSRPQCKVCLKVYYNIFSLTRHGAVCKGLEKKIRD